MQWCRCRGKTWQFLKNTPALCPRNPTFRYLTKKTEKIHPHNGLHTSTHNSQEIKTTSEWINEICHIHTMEYYKNEVHIIKYYNGGEPKKSC